MGGRVKVEIPAIMISQELGEKLLLNLKNGIKIFANSVVLKKFRTIIN